MYCETKFHTKTSLYNAFFNKLQLQISHYHGNSENTDMNRISLANVSSIMISIIHPFKISKR